ncbi:hypothetical protein GGH95_005212 [Coemansia sp. RSA 1836]|nr:hypothetical protein IWW47_000982 [Coemansia sp. RSA 2052]KAJ2557200.1 hypothetical protein GGH95_005212 [Coemansia sp. RSA 1836]
MGPARKTGKSAKGPKTASPYSVFFQRELKKIKQENPEMSHKDAFKQAGLNWRTSSENPKNQSKGAVADSTSDAIAAPAEPPAVKPVEKPVEKPVDIAPAQQSSMTPPISAVEQSVNVASADAAAPVAPAPAPAPAPEQAQPAHMPPPSSNTAFGIPATADEPKPTSAQSAFGKGGIPKESGGSLEDRAASPATSAANAASKPPTARALTPVIPSMATHTVPGALTAAK